MIEGVQVRRLELHADERGSLTELLRADWPEYTGFGQAIVTLNRVGVVRAWHWHRRQTDRIVVVSGMARVPLYDGREDSPTRGVLKDHLLRGDAPTLLVVPPGVLHGYRTVGTTDAIILNFPDRVYDSGAPDEERIPADSPEIGYDWELDAEAG